MKKEEIKTSVKKIWNGVLVGIMALLVLFLFIAPLIEGAERELSPTEQLQLAKEEYSKALGSYEEALRQLSIQEKLVAELKLSVIQYEKAKEVAAMKGKRLREQYPDLEPAEKKTMETAPVIQIYGS